MGVVSLPRYEMRVSGRPGVSSDPWQILIGRISERYVPDPAGINTKVHLGK